MTTFGSLFSGIGGFDLGFERAGMSCKWQVEIDSAATSVLDKHWSGVPKYKDVRNVGKNNLEPVDVICGGFPCQDLSIAGKRAGLDGERSGLWFEFRRIVEELRPKWVIVENVPGLLSSNGGADFAIVIRGLVECGYGVCWRVLDSQYFGVAQRRRRVFIVGSLGNGRAAEVLFEREGGIWDTPPSREKGQGTAAAIVSRIGKGGFTDPVNDNIIPFSPFSHYDYEQAEQSATIHNSRQLSGSEHMIVQVDGAEQAATLRGFGHGWQGQHNSTNAIVMAHGQANAEIVKDGSPSLTLNHEQPIVAYNIMPTNSTKDYKAIEAKYSQALTTDGNHGSNQGGTYIVYDLQQITSKENRSQIKSDYTPTLNQAGQMMVGVRRLTPTECERLQGFPDGWTDGQSDSARYRQLGNAVTVNVAEWIGRRIVEA